MVIWTPLMVTVPAVGVSAKPALVIALAAVRPAWMGLALVAVVAVANCDTFSVNDDVTASAFATAVAVPGVELLTSLAFTLLGCSNVCRANCKLLTPLLIV